MRTGIVRSTTWYSLAYGCGFGFGYPWLPESIQHLIVHNLNWVTCRLFGHKDYGFGACCNCSKPLPPQQWYLDMLENDE